MMMLLVCTSDITFNRLLPLTQRSEFVMNNPIKTIQLSTDNHPTIIGHCIAKGGVGKTSMSVFHALRLAELGYRVLVIDTDLQEQLSKAALGKYFEVAKKNCFRSDSLFNPEKRVDEISVCESQDFEGFDVIPAHEFELAERNTQIDRVGGALSGGERSRKVAQFVEQTTHDMRQYLLQMPYDYIVIDFSPSTSLIQTMFTWCLDRAFIPIKNDELQMDMVKKTLARLSVSKKKYVKGVEAWIYINMFDKPAKTTVNVSTAVKTLDKIRNTYKSNLLTPYAPSSSTIHAAYIERRAPWVRPPSGGANKAGRVVKELIDKMNRLVGAEGV